MNKSAIANTIRAFVLNNLGFHSKENLFEDLYLQALIDSFDRIDKTLILEEKIRDAFIRDLENENLLTYELIENQILILTFERWINLDDKEKSRADICFSIPGFEFILECKVLKFADSKYIEEGIKRFVELKYADKDDFAGMIGFILKGNPQKIITNLKKKVKKCSPTPDIDDYLKKQIGNWEFSFQSKHQRINQTEIHLYHLFFDFSDKTIRELNNNI